MRKWARFVCLHESSQKQNFLPSLLIFLWEEYTGISRYVDKIQVDGYRISSRMNAIDNSIPMNQRIHLLLWSRGLLTPKGATFKFKFIFYVLRKAQREGWWWTCEGRAIYISMIHGLGNQKRTINLQGKTLKTHPQPCPLFCEEEKSQKGLSQIHTFLWQFELDFVDPNPVLTSATPLFWQIKNAVTGLIEKSN